jgi:hypothetical protein
MYERIPGWYRSGTDSPHWMHVGNRVLFVAQSPREAFGRNLRNRVETDAPTMDAAKIGLTRHERSPGSVQSGSPPARYYPRVGSGLGRPKWNPWP